MPHRGPRKLKHPINGGNEHCIVETGRKTLGTIAEFVRDAGCHSALTRDAQPGSLERHVHMPATIEHRFLN
jgi:hypothetical protein